MEALNSSETSVLTRTTRHNIPEDIILHSHRRENFKSYMDDVTLAPRNIAKSAKKPMVLTVSYLEIN
jgi:hypothetical protein